MNFEHILRKAVDTHNLAEEEIFALLSAGNTNDSNSLFKAADDVRKKYIGDEVELRGLVEFSNYCFQNCLYCGLRRDNEKTERYRLSIDEILKTAQNAKKLGYKTLVLQSGEDTYYTVGIMAEIIKQLKNLDFALTLSIGEKSFEEYKIYRQAGADRYLLRIETTDKELYENLDPQMSFENRLRCLRDLQKLGYEVGSGILVGLPGQTLQSIAKDILFLKNFPVDMAGIGPFIANPDTPLAEQGGNYFNLSLKVMAVMRLLMPDINIPATTAMESLNPRGRLIALESGANVVMPNVTEGIYRKLYALYPGKICTGESPNVCRFCIEGKIKSIGRAVGAGYGASRRYVKNSNRF
jgi:biotin synthase